MREESKRLRTMVKETAKNLSPLHITIILDYDPDLSHFKQRFHNKYEENPAVKHFSPVTVK